MIEENFIFVFGSNTEGRHGKGAALYARQKYGAKNGQPRGLQGNSYAIVTKNLNPKFGKYGRRSIPLLDIKNQLLELSEFAIVNKHLDFIMTKIGTNNAGYTNGEIKSLMDSIKWSQNVHLPNWD